jgi:3-phenylpropionate/trans-cinnamate dioxygenase ferredoxin subunit
VPNYVKVARADEIGPGEKQIVEVDGIEIVIVNLAGTFFAIEDVCTHDGGPLGEGKLDRGALTCPRHGARFDVRTGAALSMPAIEAAPTYAVKVEDGDVFVESLEG